MSCRVATLGLCLVMPLVALGDGPPRVSGHVYRGRVAVLSGRGFLPGARLSLQLDWGTPHASVACHDEWSATATADPSGRFVLRLAIPRSSVCALPRSCPPRDPLVVFTDGEGGAPVAGTTRVTCHP